MTDDRPDLGPCCCCDQPATGIAMLDFRSPEPGKGWGCVVCGLEPAGAIAVLCDACGEACARRKAPIHRICLGYPAEGRRAPWPDDPVPHRHDLSRHPELLAPRAAYDPGDDPDLADCLEDLDP